MHHLGYLQQITEILIECRSEVAAHGEVKTKLSRFMRSRWFKPPFSGAALSDMLSDTLRENGLR